MSKTLSAQKKIFYYLLLFVLSIYWVSPVYLILLHHFPLLAFKQDIFLVWQQPLFYVLSAMAFGFYIYGFRKKKIALLKFVTEILFLILMPIWGFFINADSKSCDACATVLKPLVEPDAYSLATFYFLCVFAYFIAKKQKKTLAPLTEFLINAFLICGILICLSLALHFQAVAIFGIIIPPLAGPLIAPLVVMVYFFMTLVKRLKHLGKAHQNFTSAKGFWMSFGMSLPILGLWALLHNLIYSRWFWQIFTLSCGKDWLFALQKAPPKDCHYLCTVAARGSPRLVKPLHLGTRRGRPIIVNRQLQIANAFEDLLHTRWPRFGKFCRKVYDKTGFPISHRIQKKWQANVIYIFMKPFEWLFWLTLLLLDSDPEARLKRMYR